MFLVMFREVFHRKLKYHDTVSICITLQFQILFQYQFRSAKAKTISDQKIQDFKVNSCEQVSLDTFHKEHEHFSSEIMPSNTFLNLQSYMHVIRQCETEKSDVVYLQVLDAKSDSRDTLNANPV